VPKGFIVQSATLILDNEHIWEMAEGRNASLEGLRNVRAMEVLWGDGDSERSA
jgi:hypothetical protein